MSTRSANARWEGDLQNGKGSIGVESGTFQGSYTFASRFEDGAGTNPEELIGAAHAGCFSMALSNELADAGYEPDSVETDAEVTLEVTDAGPAITGITLTSEAAVPGIDDDEFQEFATGAKDNCPVSKALGAVDISLRATLRS